MGETKNLKKNILSKNNSQTRICLGDTTKSKEYSGTGGKWCFRAQIRMRNPRVCVRPPFFKKRKKQQKTTTRNKKQQTRNNKDGKTKKHKQKLVGKKTWEKQKI